MPRAGKRRDALGVAADGGFGLVCGSITVHGSRITQQASVELCNSWWQSEFYLNNLP